MKLSNLEIASTLRLTQPNVDDELQTLDIEFDITQGAVLDNELYELAFYNMLNGYSTGVDGVPTTGFKFTYYDQDDMVIAETQPVKIDKVINETYTRLEAEAEVVSVDTSADVYLCRVTISYISNDNDVEKEFMVLESKSCRTTTFSEEVPASDPAIKGVLIADGMPTKFGSELALYWRS